MKEGAVIVLILGHSVTMLTKKTKKHKHDDHSPSGDNVVLGEWHRGIVGLVVYRGQTVGLTGEFSFSSMVREFCLCQRSL